MRGGLQPAVLADVIDGNPVQGIAVRSKRRAKRAPALTAVQLRELIEKVQASEECRRRDLADLLDAAVAGGDMCAE